PKRKGLLYAGTETGVYVSFNDGANWQRLQLNLPTSPIHDLVVKDNDLVVATHGRSFWILDDLEPLRQMSEQIGKADAHLFTPSPALRFRGGGGFGRGGVFAGENPPNGAIVYYHLKEKAKGEITLQILNAKGEVIREYSSIEEKIEGKPLPERPQRPEKPDLLPIEPGMHRFVWNLRYDMPDFVPNVIWDMGAPSGPLALPGKYTVRLNVAGKSYTAPLEVRMDPRVTTPMADLQKQFALLMDLRKLIGDTHAGVLEIRAAREQLGDLRKRLGNGNGNGDGSAIKELSSATLAIEKKMAPLEAELIEVLAKSSQDMCNYPAKLSSKIGWLDNVVDSADTAPTQQSLELYKEFRARADREL
ncbi:MAG: glycosyl hydrolase, partial [Candidatus Acidiferrales bacterium]